MNIENKEKIAKGALNLFLAQGIKPVTMDKIASALSISKRTIYENFVDKEALVTECMLCMKTDISTYIGRLKETSENSLSLLLGIVIYSLSYLRKINPNFFIDAKAMLPNSMSDVQLERNAQVAEFNRLIAQSQKDGHISETYSSELLAQIFYGMIDSMKTYNYDYSKSSYHEILYAICDVYFQGVATKEGYEVVKKYLDNKKFDNNN